MPTGSIHGTCNICHMHTAVLGHCFGCYLIGTNCRWPSFCCVSKSGGLEWWLYGYAERQRMNKEQVKAFLAAFTNRITLIQGPPGTGKTLTAALIIGAFAELGKNILLTSGSNAAIDNVSRKLDHRSVKKSRQVHR